MFTAWNSFENGYAHVGGRIVCFNTEDEAQTWIKNKNLGSGWAPADMHHPTKVLYFETRHADHKYLLYEDVPYCAGHHDVVIVLRKPIRATGSDLQCVIQRTLPDTR